MLGNLFNAIEWLIVLVVLFAFVIGAWRHTVEQTLGDPLLVDPAPNAKAKRYFTLLGKALWHIAMPTFMVARIILEFMGGAAANDETPTSSDADGDYLYKHSGDSYYSHTTPGDGDGKSFYY
jgi:hypothetical protein